MPTIAEVRAKYPQYEDLSDEQLADALHRKFYADMPREQFDEKIGLEATRQPEHPEFDGSHIPGYNPETGRVEKYGKLGSAAMGAADMWTWGVGDEVAAGAATLIDKLPGMEGRTYSQNLAEIRGNQEDAYQDNPKSYVAGMVGGGVSGGAALAKSGLSLAARAASRGAPLRRVALGGSGDGAIVGGVHGAGSGADAEDRAKKAVTGAVAGGVIGGASPLAVAGVAEAGRRVAAPVMARLRPQSYADRAVAEGLRRSGHSADEVAAMLTRAQADDQGMFTVADAMGHSGQRMLSTVARNPNEMRQTVVDTLHQRQMGQGERLSRTLADGFDAPDTAAQRAAGLTRARSTSADANYEAARQGAGAVDVSGAIAAADDILQPGVTRLANPASGIADDSLEGVIRRARALLTDGRSTITDFNSVLRAKQDISDMIGAAQRAGRGNQVRLLSSLNTRLDEALEAASPGYRAANDTFRTQSRTIDAVETGTAAASGRTRAADNIARFQSMTPEEQAAFRAGYADPMIARVEAGAAAPSTNKARMLMTEKTGQEFPAFAAPGRADRMGNRIAREQRMFETANTALGGSKTADNLADAAEMSKFDPGVMTNLLRGRPIAAAIDAVAKLVNEARGMPPQVMERIAQTLLETRPDVARRLLEGAGARRISGQARQALTSAILTNVGAKNPPQTIEEAF